MLRKLAATGALITGSLFAGTISSITITNLDGSRPNEWDTPVGAPAADIWVQIGSTYGAYANNLLTVNPGDSGVLTLRLEGFGGFADLIDPDYSLALVHGPDTLTLACSVSGTSCTSTAADTVNGLTISDLNMVESDIDIVAAFATGPPPGSGPNSSVDIAVTLNYDFAAPEPATVFLLVAGLAGLAVPRRRR